MIQGIHLAVRGMTPQMQKQDQIANNLANANTTGFKQSGLFIKAFQKYLADEEQQPYAQADIRPDEVYIDYREGPMKKTGAPLDLAIKGSGFFSVMTPEGVRYTRNGNFSFDAQGFLVDGEGARVLGTEGYIKFPEATKQIMITDRGEVFHGDDSIGKLRIADFKKPYEMTREGNGYFRPLMPDAAEIESPGYKVNQGYLEASNVNVIKNMVDMITSFRTYEAEQKALIAQNETLDKAVNQVGRLS